MKLVLLPAVAVAAFAQSAFAASILPRQETQEIHIVLQIDKANDRAAIGVYNQDKSILVAQSCSRTLSSNGLDIAFNVDKNGGGNFTVGSQSYNVNDDVETATGINTICGRIATAEEVVLSCLVPNTQPLSGVAKRDLKTCFPEGQLKVVEVLETFEAASKNETVVISSTEADAQAEAQALAVANANATAPASLQESTLDKRCFGLAWRIDRVGNGNPHQNPWNIQLSVPMECGAFQSCSVSYTHATSYSINWFGSISGASWIQAGFGVTTTVETGTSHQCDGNPGDYFAIWKNVGTTAYTVQKVWTDGCHNLYENPYILWSPNMNDWHSQYYCVYSRQFVRNKGDRWLDIRDDMPYGAPL